MIEPPQRVLWPAYHTFGGSAVPGVVGGHAATFGDSETIHLGGWELRFSHIPLEIFLHCKLSIPYSNLVAVILTRLKMAFSHNPPKLITAWIFVSTLVVLWVCGIEHVSIYPLFSPSL